jgi:hypothetical protein
MFKFRFFFFFSFGNPTNKTKTGIAYTWGTTNSKPPGPIIMINQIELLNYIEVQFIKLFFGGCTTVLHLLPATASCTNLVQKKQFPKLNQHILTLLQQILLSRVLYGASLEMLQEWQSNINYVN